MANPSKNIGTAAESAVVKVFKDAGFRAKRLTLHGSKDVGDIDIGIDSVVIEVKGGRAAENASDGQIEKWLKETDVEVENARATYGILIVKRKGIGPANAGQWWAIMRYRHFERFTADDWVADVGEFPVRLHLRDLIGFLPRPI